MAGPCHALPWTACVPVRKQTCCLRTAVMFTLTLSNGVQGSACAASAMPAGMAVPRGLGQQACAEWQLQGKESLLVTLMYTAMHCSVASLLMCAMLARLLLPEYRAGIH